MGCRLLRIALIGDITTLRRITLRSTRIATLRRISHLLVDSVHHITALSTCHTHAHEAQHGTALIAGCGLHSLARSAGHISCASIRIGQRLQIADVFFILVAGLNAAYAKGNNLDTAQIPPFFAQHLVELVANFLGMTGQRAIAYTLSAHGTKGTVQARQKLTLELTIDFAA